MVRRGLSEFVEGFDGFIYNQFSVFLLSRTKLGERGAWLSLKRRIRVEIQLVSEGAGLCFSDSGAPCGGGCMFKKGLITAIRPFGISFWLLLLAFLILLAFTFSSKEILPNFSFESDEFVKVASFFQSVLSTRCFLTQSITCSCGCLWRPLSRCSSLRSSRPHGRFVRACCSQPGEISCLPSIIRS